MNEIGSKSALRRLGQGQKELAASLRKLADRIEQLQVGDAYEAMAWVQPHVERLLAESERILGAIETPRSGFISRNAIRFFSRLWCRNRVGP